MALWFWLIDKCVLSYLEQSRYGEEPVPGRRHRRDQLPVRGLKVQGVQNVVRAHFAQVQMKLKGLERRKDV